jgi:hypothetical protein
MVLVDYIGFFKLKADVLSLYPMPKTSLHIFDHTVKPISLYCSEIWGCYLPKSADFNFMFDYPEYQVSQPCECRNLFSMYALLSKKLVEESKRYQYLKTEVKQSNANGILLIHSIFNTGIQNMLKYKHNTFNRKIEVYTKAFYKNKLYAKRNKLLDENGKLRTYLKLKCNFGFENYLHILSDFNRRKSFKPYKFITK